MSVLTVLSIVFLLWFISGIKIAHENQRFAVWTFGRFRGLKGPDILIRLTGKTEEVWVRIAVAHHPLGDDAKIVLVGTQVERHPEVDAPDAQRQGEHRQGG